jgi:hypothetical protein
MATIDEPDEPFDRIEVSIERLAERRSGYILDLREETRTGIQALNSRIDVLSAVLTGYPSPHQIGDRNRGLPLSTPNGAIEAEGRPASRLEKLEQTVAKLLEPAA